ncbi:MAG: methyltransferase domain-containing protein [Bacteroidia bacterium]|nr:methyltransferase domain-containing protein [Bacteroidia bacterium]
MSKDTFTEKATWEKYWETYCPDVITNENQFRSLFERIKDGNNNQKFIEIGGFPGSFSIYFSKFKKYKATLLDYFISEKVINGLFEKNGIKREEIEIIETDFFSYSNDNFYDVVFSSGFIEHFDDTKNVISKHVDLIKKNGILLITLPNLTGLNGLVQKYLDKNNYNIHNIKSMNLLFLKKICKELDLKNIEIDYYGKPMVWLEATAPQNSFVKRMIKLFSLSLKLVPFKGKYFSPYIYILADKT